MGAKTLLKKTILSATFGAIVSQLSSVLALSVKARKNTSGFYFCQSRLRKDKQDRNAVNASDAGRITKRREKTTTPFWLNKLSYKNIDDISIMQ